MTERFTETHGTLDILRVDDIDDGIFADTEGLVVPHHRVTLGTVSNVESIEDMIGALRAAKSSATVDWLDDPAEAAEVAERELERDIRYLEKLDEVGYEFDRTFEDDGLATWVMLTGGPVCDECERKLDFQEDENGQFETVCRTCEPPRLG